MGKSYKKNPIIKDNGKGKKVQKRAAQHRVRQRLKDPEYEIADGKAYRKESESYDIADFVSRWSEQDARAYYESLTREAEDLRFYWPGGREAFFKEFPTVDDYLIYWKKLMKGK